MLLKANDKRVALIFLSQIVLNKDSIPDTFRSFPTLEANKLKNNNSNGSFQKQNSVEFVANCDEKMQRFSKKKHEILKMY